MKVLILTISLTLFAKSVLAKDLWLQGRVFIANTKVRPDEFNAGITSEGLKKLEKTTNFGVEITFPHFPIVEPGMRYTRRYFSLDENPSNSLTNYEAKGHQDSVLFLARLPFIHTSFFRFDVFGGVGGSNTTVSLKTAQSDGELSRSAVGDWVATPYYAAGSSVGIGFKNVLLTIEGGYESNKVNNLKQSGTIHSKINSLNLSGSYFMIGLMFDGVKGYKK